MKHEKAFNRESFSNLDDHNLVIYTQPILKAKINIKLPLLGWEKSIVSNKCLAEIGEYKFNLTVFVENFKSEWACISVLK